ncbi:MAG: ABC transporter ATP-binding protein [Bdellovibrionota bacterium]
MRSFSKGMLQRVGIAQALINDPEMVIFDEPMSGLDPVGRKDVRDIMISLKERGKTVLFSTHILSDVENLCDHAVMLVKGKLKASGTVDELVRPRIQSYDLVIESTGNVDVPNDWKSQVRILDFQKNRTIRFQLTDSINQKTILEWVQKNNLPLVSFVPHKESLEDILIQNMEIDAQDIGHCPEHIQRSHPSENFVRADFSRSCCFVLLISWRNFPSVTRLRKSSRI